MSATSPTCPLCGLRGCAAAVAGAERVAPEVLALVRRAVLATPAPGAPATDAVGVPPLLVGWMAQVADVAVEMAGAAAPLPWAGPVPTA